MRQRLQKGLQIWSGTQSHSLACSITWVLCTQITLTWYLSHLFHHTKLKTLSNNFYYKLHMISACQHFKQQKVSVPRQGDAIQLWDCWEATGRQPQSLTGHLDFRKVKKKKKAQLAVLTIPALCTDTKVQPHVNSGQLLLPALLCWAFSTLMQKRKELSVGLAALSFFTSLSKAISISFNLSSAQYSLNSAIPFRLGMGRERKALHHFLPGQQGCSLEEGEVWGPNLQQLRLQLWAQDSASLRAFYLT